MINDFGKFKKVDRKARMGRNPFTGETIKIKAMKKPRFLPAKGLKDAISGERKLGPAPKPVVVVAKPVAKPAAKKVAAKKAPAKKKVAAKKPAAKKAPAKKAPAKKKPAAKKKKK
jgi:DNA-binding protein HU-beta